MDLQSSNSLVFPQITWSYPEKNSSYCLQLKYSLQKINSYFHVNLHGSKYTHIVDQIKAIRGIDDGVNVSAGGAEATKLKSN
jgi:hypothetical protein